MKLIGRNRIVIFSISVLAIIVGMLLVGGPNRPAAFDARAVDQAMTTSTQAVAETGQDHQVKDYSEFSETLDAQVPSSDLIGFLLGLGAKLVFVVFLILCIFRLLKRYLGQSKVADQNKKPVSLLESLNLSPQRTVYVLEVGRKVLVVGASQTQLSLLTEITDPDAIEEMRASSIGINHLDQFSSLVSAAKRRFGDQEAAI